jgi:hypothetical protein
MIHEGDLAMLLRRDGDDVIAIPQPSHAWLSGQLARAWGNSRFPPPAPREEVCLAAEQHDVGWLGWEAAPELDSASGYPQEFTRVPTSRHVALWREGVSRAQAFGRYPALLVSLHAKTIYSQYFNFGKASPENAAMVRAFLDEQHALQEEITASLRADPDMASVATPDIIESNRLLIAALDRMSLEICWRVTRPVKVPDVPLSAAERGELTLSPSGRANNELVLRPWPFDAERIEVRAEGKRLSARFSDQEEMRCALERAESVLIVTVLRPD